MVPNGRIGQPRPSAATFGVLEHVVRDRLHARRRLAHRQDARARRGHAVREVGATEREQVAERGDRRAAGGRPRLRQHEPIGPPRRSAVDTGEVTDRGAAEDRGVGGGARARHAHRC